MASSVWRGNIAFGLVSIPVRLVRAARRERIQFRQVVRTGAPAISSPDPESPDDAGVEKDELDAPAEQANVSPVQRVHSLAALPIAAPSSESNPALVRPAEILKGYEVEPNRYVTFQAEEIKAAKPKTSTTIDILSFVHIEEIDPIYFDASYYVAPQPAGEKPYSILFGSLAHSKFSALGQMAMHGREHAVVIRTGSAGLILETLFYENEVHKEDQIAADSKLVAPVELKMAEAFIQAMAAKFDPAELVDRYEARMQALIDARAASAMREKSQPPSAANSAPVVDIMEALKRSLEQARKPAAKETRAKRRHAS